MTDQSETENQDLQRLKQIMEDSPSYTVTGASGCKVELPAQVRQILLEAVQNMANGKNVTLVPTEKELTTQEAADLLNVSRPHLISLLQRGEIPFHMTGTHRRISLNALTEYSTQMRETRRKALVELTRLSQEMGFYDSRDLK